MADSAAAACPQSLVDLAVRLTEAAGEVSLRYFRSGLSVETKADLSPVTLADREAEARMREILAQEAPEHGILGEEHGGQRQDRDYVWVLDPIDGTKSFITGNPLFGTLVALSFKGRPILGVISLPALGERWIGARGRPTLHRDGKGEEREVRVRSVPSLDQAILRCTSPTMFQASQKDVEAFDRLMQASSLSLFGGDCFSYAQLASGWVDLVVEGDLQPYDYMALLPVVEGAGGCASDWQGRELTLSSDGRVVFAASEALRDQALSCLRAVPQS